MPIQLDNRISYADISAWIGAAVTALYVVFTHGAEIDKVKIEQEHFKETVKRVESESKEADSNIVLEIRKQGEEQGKQFDKLDAKLDRLIDRELDAVNGS